MTLDNGSYVDSSNHYITIGEYGYYNINLSGIQSRIARANKGGTDDVLLEQIDARINLQVQTVGQTSWNIINSCEFDHLINMYVSDSTIAYTNYKDMPSIIEEGVWLNKGDKIRVTLGTRLQCGNIVSQEFMHMHVYYVSCNENITDRHYLCYLVWRWYCCIVIVWNF